MATINQLSSQDSISDSDQFPVYSSSNGDARKVAWSVLVADMIALGIVTVSSIAAALGFTPVVAANKILRYTKTSIALNSNNTDVTTFGVASGAGGLPAKWRLRKFSVYDATVTPIAASVGVFIGAGGTGAQLVTTATITALTAASKITDMTLAAVAGTDYQTSPILYVRNVAANAAALTVTFAIEIEDLT
jgi:hypothetical protein